jgi:hypothetical protein
MGFETITIYEEWDKTCDFFGAFFREYDFDQRPFLRKVDASALIDFLLN